MKDKTSLAKKIAKKKGIPYWDVPCSESVFLDEFTWFVPPEVQIACYRLIKAYDDIAYHGRVQRWEKRSGYAKSIKEP